MIWKTKSMMKVLLFLDTRQNYTASYKQIKDTFPPEMSIDKTIADVLNKNWIVKSSENKYKLTKTGEYEISKMTKKLRNEVIIDFKLVKIVRCAICMGTFPTKGSESWCPQCRSHSRHS